MKIMVISASSYMSPKFRDMIFAPRDLVINLVNGLVDRGHEVIFATSPDVPTRAKLFPGDAELLALLLKNSDSSGGSPSQGRMFSAMKRDYEIDLITRALVFAQESGVDIVHSYHKDMMHYFERLTKSVPIVYTLHDPIPVPGTLAYVLFSKFSGHNFISISKNQQKSRHLNLHFVGNVYHGIDLPQYQFSARSSDYFLFMGRLVPEKGLHTAIKLALATNTKLFVGAEFPKRREETEYFKKEIGPYLKNPLIQKVGMKEGQEKITLYGKAKALIFPIEWDEPFGMVMIEAMACGTPVIAYNRGSVSEIVRDGLTGFVVDPDRGVDGLARAVGKIDQIDRVACRKHVEEHFTVEKMVEGYERVYQKIIGSYDKLG